jgi:hypothetical protein
MQALSQLAAQSHELRKWNAGRRQRDSSSGNLVPLQLPKQMVCVPGSESPVSIGDDTRHDEPTEAVLQLAIVPKYQLDRKSAGKSAPLVASHLPKLVVYARPASCIETEIGAVRPRSNALSLPRSVVTKGHEQRRRG